MIRQNENLYEEAMHPQCLGTWGVKGMGSVTSYEFNAKKRN